MPATEDVHPIWDRELDGPASQLSNRVIRGLIKTARFRSRGADCEKKTGNFSDWMWSVVRSAWFSLAAGVGGPIICLALDPFVFSGGDEHGPFLGRYWVFFYSLIGLEILTLTSWQHGWNAAER